MLYLLYREWLRGYALSLDYSSTMVSRYSADSALPCLLPISVRSEAFSWLISGRYLHGYLIRDKDVFEEGILFFLDFGLKDADRVVSDKPKRVLVFGLYLSLATFLSGWNSPKTACDYLGLTMRMFLLSPNITVLLLFEVGFRIWIELKFCYWF